MSSRITSPFGALGERIARTRGDLPGPEPKEDKPRHPRGLHIEVLDDDGWNPGLLVAWEQDGTGQWWGRVVTVTQGTAIESMYASRLLRPVGPHDPRG